MLAPEFEHGRSVNSMKLLDYLKWVTTSRQSNASRPLTLPPVQRSALWRPRQVLNLWRSIVDGMPVGSFYLTTPGEGRRILGTGGNSATSRDLGSEGFDLLDGQQRTHALLLAVDPPTETGKCIWVEALRDRVELHLTTRAHPFGFDKNDERFGLNVLREAYHGFPSAASASSIFEQSIADGQPVLPCRDGRSEPIWPLNDLVSKWISSQAATVDNDTEPSRADFRRRYGDQVSAAMSAISRADIALIHVTPPDSAVGGKWLLHLFDRIGTGGTPLSGPERLYSMYKHHVPMVHDAVTKISNDNPGLLEPVEIARTAIRIAGTLKSKPIFWDPAPLDFPDQLARGADLRLQLDGLIDTTQADQATMLGKAFATVDRLIRYRAPTVDGEWDIGLPPVLVGDLHLELVRVLVHWAVRSKDVDVEAARGDVIRFALFWHLCVTNDAKAASQAAQILRDWTVDGSFPWSELCRRLTDAAVLISGEQELDKLDYPADPSALPLASPQVFCRWGKCGSHSSTLRSWQLRFEDSGRAKLFHRWWFRSGMLLWLQRGYLHDVLQRNIPVTAHEEDRPVHLDHIQPQASFQVHGRTLATRLPKDSVISTAFNNERWNVGNGIGNLRWVPSDVNLADGDRSISDKLRLDQDDWMNRHERRPGARDGAIDPASRELWRRASASSSDAWSEDRISAWQQAVEERAVWLYKRFYDEAGYDAWHSPASTSAAAQ